MSVQVITADCREALRAMPDESVHCVVTSPPYFGLRDYGVDGQIGLEPTPDEFVAAMVEVFHEIRRVLRKDGTCWLNIGDSYFSRTKGTGGSNPETSPMQAWKGATNGQALAAPLRIGAGELPLKQKDLIGIPWRVAFALQADGWYLRQDIIWNKPNPMPESVRDRCTKAHEYVFMLSKSARYFYDAAAVQEGLAVPDPSGLDAVERGRGRNRRSVWTIATKPFTEAHFATFPPDLPEICIKAGCPAGGTVLDPFGGAGTTGMVADRLGRNAILIELNPEYADLAGRRVSADAGMFAEVS